MRLPDLPAIARSEKRASSAQALAAQGEAASELTLTSGSMGTLLALEHPDIPRNWPRPARPMVRISPQSCVHYLPLADTLPQVLAEFSTEPNPGEPAQGRWTRLRITRVGGQYLCEKTRGPEPLEERSATVPNLESAKAFFGGGWVVKELFAKLDPVRFPRWP